MAKIAILNDTHFDYKGGNEFFLKKQKQFFMEVFWSYIDKHKITTILHLGDLFDHRSQIKHLTLFEFQNFFVKELYRRGIQMFIIPGNHDVTYKSSNEVSAVDLTLKDLACVSIINKPTLVKFDSFNISLIPWMNPENYVECVDFIKGHHSDIVAGHFDIQGCQMTPGVYSEHGLSQDLFKSYKHCWSGHYHISGTYGNIKYLGTQYEMNFGDIDDPKGFHVFDGNVLTHVINPIKIFKDIRIHSDFVLEHNWVEGVKSSFSDCIVKVRTASTVKDRITLDTFISYLTQVAYKVVVVEDRVELGDNDITSSLEEAAKDTKTVFKDIIDSMTGSFDKSMVSSIMMDLYNEALEIQIERNVKK